MLNLIKKINLTKKLLTIAEMLSIVKIQNLTKKLKIQKEDVYLKNDLFVTAGEVAQDLGISKPFAYKLVRLLCEAIWLFLTSTKLPICTSSPSSAPGLKRA